MVALFARLKHKQHATRYFAPPIAEQFGRADEHRRVRVVATRMHTAICL